MESVLCLYFWMDASIAVMESLEDVEQNVIEQAQEIVVNSIRRMRDLWVEIFDEQICQDHMSRLPEHIQTFFDEVYEESENRKTKILQTIDGLKREAANLKRLLKEDTVDGVEEHPGMPLHLVQITLDRSLEKMREKLKHRHELIEEYLFEQETLCEELGEDQRMLQKDPLPSEATMCEFRTYLDNLRAEKLQRFDDIAAMRRDIKIMMGHLGIVPQTEREQDLIEARNFPPTRINMHDLRCMHDQVGAWYDDLKENIDRVRGKLQSLWSVLAVSPSLVKRYEKYNEYTQTTYDKLFAELDRCETLRRENIQNFIEKTRVEIVQWWDKCLKSNEERSRFSTFKSEVYNEDLLTLHEMELSDLKEFYRTNETIFQLVEQRREMWDKMILLEQKSSDPSRYNNRGGKLLEEEKERKRISIQLPKIETRLLDACKRYEEENKRKFTVFGETLEDIIQEQWKKREEGKLMVSSARKKANMATPTAANRTAALTRTPRTAETMLKHTSIASRTKLTVAGTSESMKHSASKHISTVGLKRKMPSPKAGVVKRSLLKDLNSPRAFAKPNAPPSASKNRLLPPKSPAGKIPTIKVYDTKNGTKRRSRRKSQNKHRRSTSRPVPEILVTSSSNSNSTLQSESVSYEHFENFFEQNTPNRSSLMPPRRAAAATTIAAVQQDAAGPSSRRMTSRRNATTTNNNNLHTIKTPSKVTLRNPVASSTMLATTMRSPSVGNLTASGKKLMAASKNCPIIF